MIQILLVDDHPSVLEGTKMLLEQEEDIEVSLAYNGKEAFQIAVSQPFDVMLFDFYMPDIKGIDLARQVLMRVPDAKILIYTGFELYNQFNFLVENDIAGVVLKTANKDQLVTAVRCAVRGEVILPLTLVKQLRKTTLLVPDEVSDAEVIAISSKEHRILREIAKGKSNKEIADTVLMSQRSLEYALTGLFQKLKVKSRIEAAMKAKQMGILEDMDFI